MHDLDDYVIHKKEIGGRFKRFRQLISKSRQQLEEEAEEPIIHEVRISLFEQGVITPDITFIQYFTEEYGLNLTWLVKGTGPIFFKKGPKTPSYVYFTEIINAPDKVPGDIIEVYSEGVL